MGKPRTLSKRTKKLAKKKGVLPDASDSKFSIDDILDKAESFIEEYNYELAQKFCQRALEMDADNVRALETCASLLLEAGDVENAKKCLGRAVTVQPDDGHGKFMSLAQLFDGQQSLQLYQQGIAIITKRKSKAENSTENQPDLSRDLSSAFCAIADLFMTDLCDDPEAEGQCTKAIEEAIKNEENNPEAWQTKARLELIKSQFEDARKSLNHSLSLWLPSFEAVRENKPQTSGASNFDPVEVCPLLYTTRICTSKMLIELEEWDSAVKVLDGLLEEDDEVVETWYLLGWVNKLRATFEARTESETKSGETEPGSLLRLKPSSDDDDRGAAEGYNGNARYYLQEAKRVHVSVKPTDDQEMVKHIEELLEELGPEEPAANTGEAVDGEEDDWETDEDEEEMDQN